LLSGCHEFVISFFSDRASLQKYQADDQFPKVGWVIWVDILLSTTALLGLQVV
jgi:hypothetical protein